MAITREELKNRIKSVRGLTRAREDGLLDDTLIHEAIQDAQELVVMDCDLLRDEESLALVEDKWEYPVPDDFLDIREIYFIDSSGNRLPLTQLSPREIDSGRDPNDDVALEPVYFTFPIWQRRIIQPFAMGPAVSDYVA